MRDSLELRWGVSVFGLAGNEWAERRSNDPRASKFLQNLTNIVTSSFNRSHYLAACFSLNGDLLSQWRGYANDATGFSIGFSFEEIQVGTTPLEITYDEQRQHSLILDWLDHLYNVHCELFPPRQNHFTSGPFIWGSGIFEGDLVGFKNPAFDEEKEVRLVRNLSFVKTHSGSRALRIADMQAPADIRFLFRNGTPTPYIDQSFNVGRTASAIREVIIGPRNSSSIEQISTYLETLGIASVEVRKSKSSYR